MNESQYINPIISAFLQSREHGQQAVQNAAALKERETQRQQEAKQFEEHLSQVGDIAKQTHELRSREINIQQALADLDKAKFGLNARQHVADMLKNGVGAGAFQHPSVPLPEFGT